jgi:hypothetical protein
MLSVLKDVEVEEAGRERAASREGGRAWAGLRLVSGVWCLGLGGMKGLEERRVMRTSCGDEHDSVAER